MVSDTEKKTTSETGATKPAAALGTPEPSAPEPKATDIFDEIGKTLTIQIATKVFGDNAVVAMQTVARIGGHGLFEPHELAHPLFGGLQLPDPEKVITPKRNEFTAGEVGDYQFDLAQEAYEKQKQVTADNRVKTKDALTALK